MKKMISLCVLTGCLLTSTARAASPSRNDETLRRAPESTKVEGTSGPEKAGSVVVRQDTQNAPTGTPTRAIQDLEAKMDGYKTGPNLTAEDRAHNAQIKKEVITGTFDIHELCRLALDKHWGERSSAEQGNFVSMMTQLLEKKAVLSKEQGRTQGKKYYVRYLGDTYLDPQKSRVRTRTSIHVPKEDVNISIDYKLLKVGSEWKIFDVIVDDASLADNYKYQFDSIITKHGYPELVNRINQKLKEMDKS
jgi:phospholipid transport system substrate-binding protein